MEKNHKFNYSSTIFIEITIFKSQNRWYHSFCIMFWVVDAPIHKAARNIELFQSIVLKAISNQITIMNSHIKPTIRTFQVENPNDLLVRVIKERI